MVKSFVLLFILLVTGLIVHAQQPGYVDSLKRELATAKEDTNKVILLLDLANSYDSYRNPDSVFIFSQQAFKLATQLIILK
jgi:hypothetical protein